MKNLFSYLVCTGVNIKEEALNEILLKQNPYHQRRGGLGYGLHATVTTTFPNSISRGVNIRVNKNSSLYLTRIKESDYTLVKDEEILGKVKLFNPPEWLHEKLKNGRYVAEILQQHTAKNLVGIIGSTRCPLFDKGNACKFCEMSGGDNNKERSVTEIIESLSVIFKYRTDYVLTLTSPLFSEAEFRDVCYSLGQIKQAFPEIPFAFESQPGQKYTIDLLKSAGVDTWMIPLDCYSDKAQRAFMPGKQEILSKYYWEALSYSVPIFGEGNVISNLIVGFDSEEETKTAVDKIIDNGVIPDLLPIRPPIGLGIETRPEVFTVVQEYLKNKMHSSGLAQRMSQTKSGCAACGGCSAGFSSNIHKKKIILPQPPTVIGI